MYAGCRCPRCADAVLEGRTIEGCDVLACRRCGGAFVGAGVGLRLLAVLEPDVPPHDQEIPRSPCPVCRQSMKLVLATKAHVDVDTCAKHGVWFDAGDLLPVMRAVAQALGKSVPTVAGSLEAHASTSRPPSDGPGAPPSPSTPRFNPTPTGSVLGSGSPPRSTTGPVRSAATAVGDVATGVDDVTGGVISSTARTVGDVAEVAVDIVALPFELTFLAVGGLFEVLGGID